MSSVAEILQEMARNAGRSQLQRGQILGDTIANVSQLPAQVIEDRRRADILGRQQAAQDQQSQFARNADARATSDQQMQENAAKLTTEQRAIVGAGLKAGIGEGDPSKFDARAAFDVVSQAGHPEYIRDVIAAHRDLVTKPVILKEGERGFNPDTNQPIPGLSIPEKKADYTINGQRFSGETGQPIGSVVPTQTVKSIEPKSVLLDGKATIVNYDPATGKHLLPNGTDVSERVKPMPPASVIVNNAGTEAASKLPSWATDDTRPTGAEVNQLDKTILMTPNGLFQAAQNYIVNGQMPPTGRGNDAIAKAQRAAITSKVGAIAAASGMDEPALRAFFKANASSLAQQQKMYDSVQGFMATADKNAELLQKSLDKIPDIGVPVFNKPLRSFEKDIAGDPNLSQFSTYLKSVQNEYARIISQPNLAGQLTDSARHEAEVLIDPKSTVPQIVASIQALKNEGNNRLISVGEQIQRIQKRMQGNATPEAATVQPISPVKVLSITPVKR